jgi:fumarate reductase (CoM/CoB) subunit B
MTEDEKKEIEKAAEACTHCGLCTESCDFLRAHDICIGDTDRLADLAYHCFLCGECTRVCPEGVDGRGIIMMMRRAMAEGGDSRYDEKKYSFMLNEKRDYRFRNYRKAEGKTVFFPGCSFPSMFPKTNRKLIAVLGSHGIGTAYDCCGKPVAELGLESDAKRITDRIGAELEKRGVEELVTACPNCWYFLSGRLEIKVTDIYNKLMELGEIRPGGLRGKFEWADVYVPCPDRDGGVWYESISKALGFEPAVRTGAQCCGLGGSAIASEPEIAAGFCGRIADGGKKILTYCASCAGQFARGGLEAHHLLPMMLGTDEAPAIRTSYLNRVMTKFR